MVKADEVILMGFCQTNILRFTVLPNATIHGGIVKVLIVIWYSREAVSLIIGGYTPQKRKSSLV